MIEAETIIISTGATAKYLGLPDEQKYGYGSIRCALHVTDSLSVKTVAVVGEEIPLCEEVLYLAGLAKHVYLIVRKPFLRASKVMDGAFFKAENITVLFEHNTLWAIWRKTELKDTSWLKNGEADEEKVDIAIDGFFLAIGHTT